MVGEAGTYGLRSDLKDQRGPGGFFLGGRGDPYAVRSFPKNAGTCAQPGPFQRPIPSGIVFPAGSKGHPSKRGMGNCIRSAGDHDGA